ncbi:MAG: serine--tRNA ligase [Alphaproteobacteria bacterium]|jgi:seryl-tRNA synthetase|nr:serine--tRNA ligase [Alphaproteobacteria bacterium]
MHDIKWIQENPKAFDAEMARRRVDPVASEILAMDEKRRHCIAKLQELQNERNTLAKEIGSKKAANEDVGDLLARANALKDEIPALEKEEKELSAALHLFMAGFPNVLDPDVPTGTSESDNKEVRRWGEPPRFSFEARRHFELGEALGLMDFETAAKLSGARFVVLSGDLARLERALTSFMLDLHAKDFGYTPVSPPYLVKSDALFGTGQLPKFAEDQFCTTDDRWLLPTAEVALTNLVREEILDPATLPRRYVAATPCFRSEAGAAGRDTRGMIRQHQFHKVELVSITHPDASDAEHERMMGAAEKVLQLLGLPYRVMLLCTGDTGGTATKTYDLEVWLPGEATYREISSCSNTRTYQARRMNTRFRDKTDDAKGVTRFVHTLNGSGVAVGRALIAVLENYQQADGSIMIPEVLRPYMGGQERITYGQN